MRIIFNTKFPNSAASLFYKSGLERLDNIDFFNEDRFKDYDIALFMGFDEDHDSIIRARNENKSMKIGVIDPRGRSLEKVIQYIDFLIVDSIEMIDFFSCFDLPIYKYFEYTDIQPNLRLHEHKELITIGYHGNKVHLMGMKPHISDALDKLSEEFNIEFNAIYNVKALGKWETGLPSKVKVNHIQLDDKTYAEEISKIDIGIVPAFLPIKNEDSVLTSNWIMRKVFLHNRDDYLLRFKMLTNAGRLIIFGLLGVPVVSDMFPSAVEFITHGKNGYLACSRGGWYRSLKELILSSDKRRDVAHEQFKTLEPKVNYDNQNVGLIKFFEQIVEVESKGGRDIFKNKTTKRSTTFSLTFLWLVEKANKLKKKLGMS